MTEGRATELDGMLPVVFLKLGLMGKRTEILHCHSIIVAASTSGERCCRSAKTSLSKCYTTGWGECDTVSMVGISLVACAGDVFEAIANELGSLAMKQKIYRKKNWSLAGTIDHLFHIRHRVQAFGKGEQYPVAHVLHKPQKEYNSV